MDYPKALYKGGVLLPDCDADTITVNDAAAEKTAAADGYLPFSREASNAACVKAEDPAQETTEEKRKPGRPRKTEA